MSDMGWPAFVVVSQALSCPDELPWEGEVALPPSYALLCGSDPGLLRRALPTAAVPRVLCSRQLGFPPQRARALPRTSSSPWLWCQAV